MINLNEYDSVATVHDTWIDANYRCLYSYNIKYKNFFTILKKYNKINRTYDYYLIFFDNPPDNIVFNKINIRKNGLLKCSLIKFWNSIPITNIQTRQDIIVELKEETDDSIVYYLDI